MHVVEINADGIHEEQRRAEQSGLQKDCRVRRGARTPFLQTGGTYWLVRRRWSLSRIVTLQFATGLVLGLLKILKGA